MSQSTNLTRPSSARTTHTIQLTTAASHGAPRMTASARALTGKSSARSTPTTTIAASLSKRRN
ncbi:hypothetical protein BD626DRAFT_507862 [Schizophyllum amplum]|uniref:Uncharacterized protein n=1 Tax=Schizophyllum amplum TaxID=97359 RepID=A0A550C2E2_9AGAR|nr:hypothetical protein BD626DRAFT_510256 [Auriculariopsis ampla]TRM59640.1 hypothetical protein BD626DRAFT_507862 [Auriculariopsis ampla]